MIAIKLLSALVTCLTIVAIKGQDSTEDVQPLIESCCSIGTSRAKNLPTLPCSAVGRSLQPILQGKPRLVASQCTVTARMCCSRQLKATACDLGIVAGQQDADCDQEGHLSASNDETFSTCCEACKMGALAANSGRGCELDPGFTMTSDPSYQACCSKTIISLGGSAKRRNQQPPTLTDRCKISNGMCKQRCLDPGQGWPVICDCFNGYTLDRDGRDCVDVDECLVTTVCPSHQKCVNHVGGHECVEIEEEDELESSAHVSTNEMGTVRLPAPVPGSTMTRSRYSTDVMTPYEHDYRPRGNISRAASSSSSERARDSLPTNTVKQAEVDRGEMSMPAIEGKCPPGYILDRDQDRNMCLDIDECATPDHLCVVPHEECINLGGRYTCGAPTKLAMPLPTRAPSSGLDLCAAGLRKNQGLCMDINECAIGQHDCLMGLQVCQNTIGSYSCIPLSGAGFDDDRPGTPASTQSGQCARGYQMREGEKGGCEDVNECEEHSPCLGGQSCMNHPGGYSCHCLVGFQLDLATYTCLDLNECQINPNSCPDTYRCDNTVGSFRCTRAQSCGTGYTYNADLQECEDDDECRLNRDNCGQGLVCLNMEGSFRCIRPQCPTGQVLLRNGTCMTTCGTGFSFNQWRERCEDIDECAKGPLHIDPCRSSHKEQCVNTVGSYECRSLVTCGVGFEYSSLRGSCVDVDECVAGSHECASDQVCRNTPGAYVCECAKGFLMNGNRECEDMDECTRWANVCADSSVCLNTIGSYECRCKEGFHEDTFHKSCIDINECDLGLAKCSQVCHNTYGSYICACEVGFTLMADKRTCEDIDECHMYNRASASAMYSRAVGNATASRKTYSLCLGSCVNMPGSYRCECPKGYTMGLDLKTCVDENECEPNSPCPNGQDVCLNTKGSYKCYSIKCPTGYLLDEAKKK